MHLTPTRVEWWLEGEQRFAPIAIARNLGIERYFNSGRFECVVDADAGAAGDSGPRREDLRIMDAAKPALVEVKGITGTPKESSRRPGRRPTQQGVAIQRGCLRPAT